MIYDPAALQRENPELAKRAVIAIQATPRGRAYAKKEEQSGLMLVSAAPVRDRAGRIIGALYGGVMLNGTTRLVDKIKRIIYEGESFEGQNVGTATIFLGDVRIATNVLTPAGGRATGSQLSEEVYRKVIVNRERWIDRAFVVNDWYFSAYEPILDLNGAVVGALYVGMLEKPFVRINTRINLIFAGVLLFGSLAGTALSGYIGSRLARPIRALEQSARRIAAGERDVRIEVQTSDEIGALAAEFNEMTKALNQREEEIGSLNRQLERKVLERTAQLEENNLLLTRTQQELVRAGKLADLGIQAAGVAHEINNPMAIIRGNAELLQMAIPAADVHREEVDTIVQQVLRVERIVADLLQFARQEQIRLGRVALNPMLTEILRQVVHQVPLTGIELRQEYATLPELEGDGMQLRQVFTNLVLNAIQAMPDGGILTVATAVGRAGNGCVVTVSDSGCGIPPEQLESVFNPFFTTRRGGTGLGLSVSYGIVRDHGGSIEVASAPGQGTSFRVTLPLPTDQAPAA
jgi:two-component system NtrC family sensor kinase